MNKITVFFLFLFFCFQYSQAQQLSPEEKAQQAAENMQKRLGLKDRQIQQIYHLNLNNIQQARTVQKTNSYKKMDRRYQAIIAEYNHRLRSVLTPEQFQRWEMLRDEARERRKVIRYNLVADSRTGSAQEPLNPETELEHLVTQ